MGKERANREERAGGGGRREGRREREDRGAKRGEMKEGEKRTGGERERGAEADQKGEDCKRICPIPVPLKAGSSELLYGIKILVSEQIFSLWSKDGSKLADTVWVLQGL